MLSQWTMFNSSNQKRSLANEEEMKRKRIGAFPTGKVALNAMRGPAATFTLKFPEGHSKFRWEELLKPQRHVAIKRRYKILL